MFDKQRRDIRCTSSGCHDGLHDHAHQAHQATNDAQSGITQRLFSLMIHIEYMDNIIAMVKAFCFV
jgi:hypothetical protein